MQRNYYQINQLSFTNWWKYKENKMANFITKSLKSKLILLLLAVSLVPIAIVGYMSYLSGKTTIQKQFLDSLTTIVESRETSIILYLKTKAGKVQDFSSDGLIRDSLEKIKDRKSTRLNSSHSQ